MRRLRCGRLAARIRDCVTVIVRGYRSRSTSAFGPRVSSLLTVLIGSAAAFLPCAIDSSAAADDAPAPLIAPGQPVDWWFVFKFNSKIFPGCGTEELSTHRACPFGGRLQSYSGWSQQFASANSRDPTLKKGGSCLG